MRLAALCLFAAALLPSQVQAQIPVGEVLKEGSSIKFAVKASVPTGTFDKWDATIVFSAPN